MNGETAILRSRNDFDVGGFLIAALSGTLLSMALTGQVAGLYNNLFHLPLLAGLPGLPQFADDPYVRTLPHYATGFWQMLEGVAPGHEGLWLLDMLAVLSRFAGITAFLLCADALGIRQRGERVLFVALLAFSSIANGYATAGEAGLFINGFTHSELANATMLLSLWFAGRGRFFGAFAWNGVTFFINAFMAMWMVPPFVLIALLLLRRGEIDVRTMVRQMVPSLAVALVIGAPVIANFLSNPEFGRPMDHDFRTYLREYFPAHFLIDASTGRAIAMTVLTAMTGLAAALRLDRRADFVVAGLAGFCIDWIAGATLPAVITSPMLLNLHLLRAGGGVFLLTALALAALTVVVARDGGARRRFWAPLLAIGACTVRQALPLAFVAALLLRMKVPSTMARLRFDVIAIIVLLPAWAWLIVQQARANAAARDDIAAWTAIGDWARIHSAPMDRFLIPVGNILYRNPPFKPAQAGQGDLSKGFEVFSTISQRSTFVDVRSGGAAMWTPSFYKLWRQRVVSVMALADHDQRIAFAQANGLAFLVDRCGYRGALFGAGERCVYRALPQRRQFAKPYRST